MIKRETLKQAIDAISQRDPEIGFALDEMLGMGMIDLPAHGRDPMLGNDFYFLFDGQKARVSRFLYLTKGNIPIEERLLIKYGEALKKQQLLEQGESVDTPEAARTIRAAGLRLMVLHEIDYAIARVEKAMQRAGADRPQPPVSPGPAAQRVQPPADRDGAPAQRQLIDFLQALKQEARPAGIDPLLRVADVLFQASVDSDTPAFFVRFPYCLESLLQVADINIEFFHVRFLLNRLLQGQAHALFACVVEKRIVGIIYVTFRQRLWFRNLEIKFVATLRGRATAAGLHAGPALRGVGTLLVAGVWLLWKTGRLAAREIVLDAEIEARQFYETVGFESRGLSEFVLTAPRGHLLRSILNILRRSGEIDPQLLREIERLLRKQVKLLRKKALTARGRSTRSAALAAVGEALAPGTHPRLAAAAAHWLTRYRNRIPESGNLLQHGTAAPSGPPEAPHRHAAASHRQG
jgi:hypothetical protein